MSERWKNPLKQIIDSCGDLICRLGYKPKTDILDFFRENPAILDILPDSVFIKDKDSKFLLANKAVTRLMGFQDPNVVVGKTDFDFYNKELAEKYFKDEQLVISSGKRLITEEFVRPLEGDVERWYSTLKVPLLDDDGTIIGVAGIGRDITKRKKSEEAFKNLFEFLPEQGIVVNLDGIITMINKAKRESGERQPIIGKDVMYKTYAGRHEIGMHEILIDCMRHNSQKEFPELKYPDDSGGSKYLSVKISPTSEGAIILHRDITVQKRLENEVLKQRNLESLSILAGGLAHKFNNLLTSVYGTMELAKLKMERGHADITKQIEDIFKTRSRAVALTNQLLTFSRGGEPIKKTTDLNEYIKDPIESLLNGSKVNVKYQLSKDLMPTDVDILQINQVIVDLVSNAKEAVRNKGNIIIKTENEIIDKKSYIPLKHGKYVKLSIKDTGEGISEGNIGKIFDPYFTTRQDSAGLGLAIAYSIVKNHNGYISAESTLGKGTKIGVYLPASNEEVEHIPKKSEVSHSGGNILIMDDEKDVRDTIGNLIEMMGYNTQFATKGEEALEMYKASIKSKKPFDVVIMDLKIEGGLGGKETIKKLLKQYPDAKAIACSGYSDDSIIARPQEYGFKAAITKPFYSGALSVILNNVIKGK